MKSRQDRWKMLTRCKLFQFIVLVYCTLLCIRSVNSDCQWHQWIENNFVSYSFILKWMLLPLLTIERCWVSLTHKIDWCNCKIDAWIHWRCICKFKPCAVIIYLFRMKANLRSSNKCTLLWNHLQIKLLYMEEE